MQPCRRCCRSCCATRCTGGRTTSARRPCSVWSAPAASGSCWLSTWACSTWARRPPSSAGCWCWWPSSMPRATARGGGSRAERDERTMASRLLLLTLIALVLAGALLTQDSLADMAWWQQQLARCEHWCEQHPVAFTLGFALLFALMAAVTLPGCSVLSLMAGPLFGAVAGTLLVGVASTIGATASFLAARHLARPAAQARFGHRLRPVEAFLARHGRWSLFVLRLVPLVPFPVLNPLLGLTRM